MGVKDLWTILSPLCERQPLFELQGKAVAIDLSCWVVDSQTVTDNYAQPKMYLRNLFFRTSFLLMQGIMPVFVLEGKAPTLKHGTMEKRNDNRNGSRKRKKATTGVRSQFNRILKECKQILEYMGMACIQGQGEAEAMCAYLNEDGLVHGCITQDSDCFLYGAKVVYRNFSTSSQGNSGGTGGAVDKYSMDKIEEVLHLGRNKMIALALLCGCDYNEGLSGVGKEAALKFFKTVEDEDVLERMKGWRTDTILERREAEVLNPNRCTSCGHPGKVQKHNKSGCEQCGTVIKCNDSYKEDRALILNEVALRKKALLQEDFPSQELLDEFIVRRDTVPTRLDLQWKQPQIEKFIDFMAQYLTWEPQYSFNKIFPLATKWQLLNLPLIPTERWLAIPDLFIAEQIKKIRNIRSIASYEIIWNRDHSIIKKLDEYAENERYNDESQGEDDNIPKELTSIEPQGDVLKCYPDIVEAFEAARNAKSKKRPAKTRAQKGKENKENNVDKPAKKKEPKKAAKSKNNRKIEEFINANKPITLEESFEKMTITPKRSRCEQITKDSPFKIQESCKEIMSSSTPIKRGPQINKVLQLENVSTKLNNTLDKMFNELSPDDFLSDGDLNDDLNMTEIIENICCKKTFKFDSERIEKRPESEDADSNISMKNEEQVLGKKDIQVEASCSKDYANRSAISIGVEQEEPVDEFGSINESYVPLSERIEHVTDNRFSKKLSFGINDLMEDSGF